MSSWGTRVWDDWVKERKALRWQRHFLGSSKPWNFKDAVQFRTVVLAVEIDEPPTKKIRECGAKETQLSLILVIVTSCLMLPINICKFVLQEKLIIIKMRRDYVLICMQVTYPPRILISCSLAPLFPSKNQSRTQLFRQLIRGLYNIFLPKRTKESELM